jgi:hypothetical protein
MHRYLEQRWSYGQFEEMMAKVVRYSGSEELAHGYSFEYDAEELEKVLVQLTALQFIVAKTNHYEFSAKGVVEASRLRAIRKGRSSADASAWCEVGWQLDEKKEPSAENEAEIW